LRELYRKMLWKGYVDSIYREGFWRGFGMTEQLERERKSQEQYLTSMRKMDHEDLLEQWAW